MGTWLAAAGMAGMRQVVLRRSVACDDLPRALGYARPAMTPDDLERALAALGTTERSASSWRLTVAERTMTCLVDTEGDALRLVCPVAELSALSERDKDSLLEVSFHASLVARFAAFDGVVVAVWGGRLSTLDDSGLADAVAEVVALASCIADPER